MKCVLSAVGGVDCLTALFEPLHDEQRDLHIIFGNQDSHLSYTGIWCVSPRTIAKKDR